MLWRPGSKPWVWSQAEQSYRSGPLEGWEIELEHAQGSAGSGEGTSRAINCIKQLKDGGCWQDWGSGFGVRQTSRALQGWEQRQEAGAHMPSAFPSLGQVALPSPQLQVTSV